MGRSGECFWHDLTDAPFGLTDGVFGLMGKSFGFLVFKSKGRWDSGFWVPSFGCFRTQYAVFSDLCHSERSEESFFVEILQTLHVFRMTGIPNNSVTESPNR